MPSARLLPNLQRHDLSKLPYAPNFWQRIAGPWSITFRAYLWTAPLGILLQPVVEPDFWNRPWSFWLWIVNAFFCYLVFGIVLWLGKRIIELRASPEIAFAQSGISIPARAIAVIAIAVIASMTRSVTIGLLLEPLGLQGVSSVERLPFGAFLGFAWVITSSLIMDTKYRFKFHLDEVVANQRLLLSQIQTVQNKISKNLKESGPGLLENSHRRLQQAIRELAILSNSTSIWTTLVPQLRLATLHLTLTAEKESWTADKNFNDLRGTRYQALKEITTKPLMNLPLVIAATAVITFFGGTRLYPVRFVIISLIIGLGVHVVIIVVARLIIQRISNPSSFPYVVMIALMFLVSLLLPIYPHNLGYELLPMRGITLAATLFELVWLFATGFVIFNSNQRQQIITNAHLENNRLQAANGFITKVDSGFDRSNYDPTTALDLISQEINRARVDADLDLAREALEFSSLLFSQISESLSGTAETSIEKTLERLSAMSANTTEVFWTVTGSPIPDSMQPRISAALEICVSKATRHGQASLVSIEIKGSELSSDIKVTDNGHEHDDGGIGLGVEILQELTGNTWSRHRSGGLNIVTARFSNT